MQTNPNILPARAHTRGTILGGKYRLDQTLGRGGSGRVFRATQLKMGRTVAIKVLRYDLEPSARRLYEHRFLREASRAGSLQHPNVVTIHDYDRQPDGTCYIVMELVRGMSLGQLILDGPLEPERVLHLFEQVVKGLRAAHAAGLVHRDVKPGNILVAPGEDGRDLVKLVDFGLVRAHTDKAVTAEGVFLGTPNYVAPEQARGGRSDPRSDLYSCGVVMYRCLTGTLPYTAPSPVQVVMAHLREPYPPMDLRLENSAVPLEVEEIVQRCMEKEVEHRYQTAEELLTDIRRVRLQLYNAAPSDSGDDALAAIPTDSFDASGEVGRTLTGALTGWFGRPTLADPRRAAQIHVIRTLLGAATAAVFLGLIVGVVLLRTVFFGPAPEPVAPGVPLPLPPQVQAPEVEEPSLYPVRTEHHAADATVSRPAADDNGFLFPPVFGEDAEEDDVWGALGEP